MKSWFRFANADTAGRAVIYINDYIGSWDDDFIARNYGYDMGVTARAFLDQLSGLESSVNELHIHINSPGGDVEAGVQIANALRAWGAVAGRSVVTFIDGIAASIASVIAQAGSRVVMADTSLLMIHNPWTVGIGNANELRALAEVLDKVRGQIVAAYKWHATAEESELVALMDAETYLAPDEAIALGLATEKIEGLKASASLTRGAVMARLASAAGPHRERIEALLAPAPAPAGPAAPVPATAAEIMAEAPDLELARTLVAERVTLAEARTRVAAWRQAQTAEAARRDSIRGVCKLAGLEALADGYIAGGMSVDLVRTHVATVAALADRAAGVDGALLPDAALGTAPAKRVRTAAEVYEARRKGTAAAGVQ